MSCSRLNDKVLYACLVMASIAQFEREVMLVRQGEGIDKARGDIEGRNRLRCCVCWKAEFERPMWRNGLVLGAGLSIES